MSDKRITRKRRNTIRWRCKNIILFNFFFMKDFLLILTRMLNVNEKMTMFTRNA
jgi:energy-converting hydrogenase A subunit M